MPRAIDQLLFPELFGEHIIDANWLWDDDDAEDVDDVERQPYHLWDRATVDASWTEEDFFKRFRVRKSTFRQILEMITPALQHPNRR